MKLINNHNTFAVVLFALSSTAFANTPTCISAASDSDSDGWGWENGASCIVANATIVESTLISEPTTTSTGTIVCSSPNADRDGDGWGWENNASCVVLTSPVTSTVSSSNDTTYCGSADSDPDGDGWGWENNSSCQTAPASVTGPSNTIETNTETSTGGITTVIAIGPAQCTSAVSDEDGDGWGWENNQSCIVITQATGNAQPETTDVDSTEPAEPQIPEVVEQQPIILLPCSVPALDDNNDGIGRENNQDCTVETPVNVRIMALGDSITHGTSRGPAESYRKHFTNLMTSNACQFEMVGSQTGNHFHNTFVSPHEGYNGHTADNILNGFIDNAGNNEGISVTANRYQPHVVLLHIGSNDMRVGQGIDQTVAEIDQIISVILATDSAPVVMLANVIPWWANAAVGANVEILGDRIEAYVAQLNNPRVRLVDVRSGFERSMMLADGAHPNPTGEQLIAERFLAAYDSAGFCR